DRRLEPIRCGRSRARYYTRRHISRGLTLAGLRRSGLSCDAATPMVVCADRARAVLVDLACYHLGSASPARTAQSSCACGRLAQGSSPRDEPAQPIDVGQAAPVTGRRVHGRRWHSQERIRMAADNATTYTRRWCGTGEIAFLTLSSGTRLRYLKVG